VITDLGQPNHAWIQCSSKLSTALLVKKYECIFEDWLLYQSCSSTEGQQIAG